MNEASAHALALMATVPAAAWLAAGRVRLWHTWLTGLHALVPA